MSPFLMRAQPSVQIRRRLEHLHPGNRAGSRACMCAPARNRLALALPFSGEFLELMQYLLDIFHAIGYPVSDGGRNSRFVMAEDEPRVFERSQAFRQHSCRDTFYLPP